MPHTMPYFFELGNHPDLSLAELWSVLSAGNLDPQLKSYYPPFAEIEVNEPLPLDLCNRLGGIVRITQPLAESLTPLSDERIVSEILAVTAPDKKTVMGLSLPHAKEIGKKIKLQARAEKKKIRFILPNGSHLNAAQVKFNHLITAPNFEVILHRLHDRHVLLRTLHIQDIQKYEQRDHARPKRNAHVGMLPPKLAQIIINIAAPTPRTVLDPFCGLGTILQEGWLLNHLMIGADKEERMIQATNKNLDWIQGHFSPKAPRPKLHARDATRRLTPLLSPESLDAIVTEPFLGPPLRQALSAKETSKRLTQLGDLYLRSFKSFQPALKPGGTVLFLLPAFLARNTRDTYTLLPERFLDAIEQLGYSRQHLVPEDVRAQSGQDEFSAIYARPHARVGRQLTLWHKS